jgi:predicted transcriptional regulator
VPPTKTTLILPDALKARVMALAGKQRRSMHSQLLVLIERGLRAEERAEARREAPQPR